MLQRIVFFVAAATVLSYGQGLRPDQSRLIDSALIEQEALQRAQARAIENRFVKRANRVAALWANFTKEYNEKNTVNAKLAREISKAFHDLETDEDWPKDRSK